MFRSILLSFFIITLISCDHSPRTPPEPAYNPHILKPTRYVPTQGKKVNMDSVARPQFVPAIGRYVQAGQPRFVPKKAHYQPAGKPFYLPVQVEVIKPDSVVRPKYLIAEGEKIQTGWPQWQSVQMAYKENSSFTYLGVEQGLNSPYIFSMLEDQFGRIWMAHHDGTVGVWDGKGYMHYTASEGLKTISGIFGFIEDRDGKIWMGTYGGGLSVWDGTSFTNYGQIFGARVNTMMEDSHGKIWLGTDKGLVYWESNSHGRDGYYLYTTDEGLSDNRVNSILEDEAGRIWIATARGLNTWDGERFSHFLDQSGWMENKINCLLEDQHGNLWMGTSDGLCQWNGQDFSCYTTAEGLSGNQVGSLLEDQDGNVWIETDNGISVWDGSGFSLINVIDGINSRSYYSFLKDHSGRIWIGTNGSGISISGWKGIHHQTMADGLSDNVIFSILEDRAGRIWIGTQGGVNRWNPNNGQEGFAHYTESEGLISNFVRCMVEDDEGRIWMGTDHSGVSVWDGKAFIHYTTAEGLSNDRVWSIFKDNAGRIWIGTNGGGVNVWDGNGFTQFTTKQGLTTNNVFGFLEDRKGRIWIGTYAGVSVWDPEGHKGGTFTHFTTENGLGDNRVGSFIEDDKGHIWIGSSDGGVHLWDGEGMYQYTEAGGLSQDIVWCLAQDDDNNIWVGTFKGLNQLSPTNHDQEWQLRKFNRPDGLRGISINNMQSDKQHRLWLGTSKGLSRIDLDQIRQDTIHPSLFLWDLQPFFEFVDWRQVQDSLKNEVVPKTKQQQIALSGVHYDSVQAFTNLPINPEFPHHINDLTFHWSGIHSIGPHELRYSYLLEGNDAAWSPPLPENQIRLQNLRPGDYTFKLRAVGINGQWSETAVYPFRIRPPWWATLAAYLAYGLLVLALFYGIYRFQLNRQLAEAEAHRLRELDTFKSNLYTNITHEFRTPLTVIMGMVQEIRGHERIKSMIKRNSNDLLQLVNQMLDLRKLEVGSLQLNLVQSDVIPLLKYLVESFHSTAESKSIRLSFHSPAESLLMDHDPERLRQVVTNLLANALKFTPAGGEVLMTATSEPSTGSGSYLSIKVKDKGSGIPEEQLPFIFDRFYQADSSVTRRAEGTGIGLALVKELVTAMEGSIAVESRAGRGTEFLVRLPVRRNAALMDTNIRTMIGSDKGSPVSGQNLLPAIEHFDAPIALIVEDNRDVVEYLNVCLQDDYQVRWAANGREGLEQALEIVPDIIITDVMMPEMDGFTLCRKLKTDERTSHIPIIMLTARAAREDRLTGLERGADVYLMKPFDKVELEIHLRKLIELRKNLREKYGQAELDLLEPGQETDPELQFLKKLQMVVLENLSDENFKVEPDLCRAMTMSRPQLYRKLKALKAVSPSEYLRNLRMQKARQLLLRTDLSIGEVAEEVGFKDPSYFAKVYIATFDEAPSQTPK